MERWRRTLAVTAVAQSFSMLGFSFVVPFMPLYIQQLGIHGAASITLWAALLSGGTALCMAITSPFWGVLADRHGRKIMVVRAALSAAIIVGLMGAVQNIWQLLLLRLLQGMFTGTVSASQALVASESPRDRVGFALGIMQTAVFIGISMGPVLGGLMAAAIGFRLSFGAAAVVLFVSGVLIALFVHEELPTMTVRDRPHPRLFSGMRDVLAAPALLAMIAAIFAVQFAVTVVFPVLPQFVQELQGPGGQAALGTGVILTGAGAAGALSSVLTGWVSDRVGYQAILATAAGAAALVSIPQFFVTTVWQLVLLRIAGGFALGAIMPAASALLALLVPPERRGTAYGLSSSANSLGAAIGPLTAALVVSLAGIRAVFLTSAILLGAIALWVGLMIQIPAEDETERASADRTRRPA